MNAPSARPRPTIRPLQGSEWLGARLTLATRRNRTFTRWWTAVGGVATVVALLIPVATGDPQVAAQARVVDAARDTVTTSLALSAARSSYAAADTALQLARVPTTRAAVAPSVVRPADPRLPSLEAAIERAATTRALEAVLSLAEEPAVRYGPRMRATADSLRVTIGGDETTRLTNIILGIARFRRNEIAAEQPTARLVRPEPSVVDTAEAVARVATQRDSLASATARHSDALAALASAQVALDAGRGPVPPLSPGLVLLVAVIGGLVLRIGFALMREIQEPTLAVPQEAEHAVGAPVLAHVRDALPEGPLRFRPSGVDPFRVLYLGLTATGTRARSLIVTGADPVIVAAVGARLAIAAAADHRTTLVAELDPEQVALARVFRDHPEPGFTDALAGNFKWREVARPVGSSDGLLISMIPAGTTRDAASEETARAEAHSTFATFRDGFEFTILAVGLKDLDEAKQLLRGAPIVICATLGETPVGRFTADGAAIQQDDVRLHSVVLWDAPRPVLPSRAELAAYLSKRKGRTPGGSFKAVQEATKKPL